jgi:6-phosphofructokinase 1
MKKIALLTSGGDAPGMNAAIRAIVRTAIAEGMEVLGIQEGFKGLVENNIREMTTQDVANCIQRGGTILKTTRYPEFKEAAVRQKAIANIRAHGIEGLIILGGDGSFYGASLLSNEVDIAVIGIPCTIDNDITGTTYTIGFDTARNTALEAIDKIRDTAFSHSNNFLVEVMGHFSGFLALDVGIAGGAEYIILPEVEHSASGVIEHILHKRRLKMGSIIVVAEATEPGWSFQLAKDIEEKTGVKYKVCILGHTQRGGKPSAYDRKVASMMGYEAVQALLKGEHKKMISLETEDRYFLADFPSGRSNPRKTRYQEYLAINHILCG